MSSSLPSHFSLLGYNFSHLLIAAAATAVQLLVTLCVQSILGVHVLRSEPSWTWHWKFIVNRGEGMRWGYDNVTRCCAASPQQSLARRFAKVLDVVLFASQTVTMNRKTAIVMVIEKELSLSLSLLSLTIPLSLFRHGHYNLHGWKKVSVVTASKQVIFAIVREGAKRRKMERWYWLAAVEEEEEVVNDLMVSGRGWISVAFVLVVLAWRKRW